MSNHPDQHASLGAMYSDYFLDYASYVILTLRKAMLAAGQDGKGKIAHHTLPIAATAPDLEIKFLQRGIDPNDAEHGLFLTNEKHDLIHGKGATGWEFRDPYLFQWDRFFKRNPSPDFQAVIDFREQLKAIISQDYRHADDIPWPIPKTTP